MNLTISYVGYGDITETFDLKADVFKNISLEMGRELEEVVISANSSKKIHEQTQMSTIQLPIKQIEKLPSFMGERDILKTIQLLPGIQSGSEGTSGLYVRGGWP